MQPMYICWFFFVNNTSFYLRPWNRKKNTKIETVLMHQMKIMPDSKGIETNYTTITTTTTGVWNQQ